MSDGATHARVAGAVLFLGAGAGAVLVTMDPTLFPAAMCTVLGLANGYLVTPDIDMQGTTIEEIRWKSFPLIGRLLFFLFASFWYPYSLLFAHRGWSHVPVFGTVSRLVYEVVTLGGFAWLLFRPEGIIYQKLLESPELWMAVGFYFLGWMVQDFGHLVMDIRPPWNRAKKPSRRRVRAGNRRQGHYPTAPSYQVLIEALKGTA